MKKMFLLVIVLLVLAGGWFYLSNKGGLNSIVEGQVDKIMETPVSSLTSAVETSNQITGGN